MSRYGGWRAYVVLLLSCFPLLLSGPGVTAPVRVGSPASSSVQTGNVVGGTAPLNGVGPRATITCPAGSVSIASDQSIQSLVNMHPGGTTFCLRAGVHRLTSSITPKTGNTFVGEYGAILDGTGWSTTDPDAAAFKALSVNVDFVAIRNLTIRNMPQHGITVYYLDSDHWTIEYNEIANNKFGIEFAPNSTIRYNYIHHNVSSTPKASKPAERGGAYLCQRCDDSVLEANEIAYNGTEQKIANHSANVVFRNNFVHHNLADGIWYDTNRNAGALIEGNRVEDNGRDGISFEASIGATIRNNTIRRNADAAVFISLSQNARIYSNTLEANVGGILYFLNCDVLSGDDDLKNNAAYGNRIVFAPISLYATGFSPMLCTSEQLAPYLDGSKNLTFSGNTYVVPSAFGRYWPWDNLKFWNEWQALGHDVGGSLSQ